MTRDEFGGVIAEEPERDEFGGVIAPERDEFGGIISNQAKAVERDEFGGVITAEPGKKDPTMGSQLAVKVPEVMSEWGVEFPKEMPGLSASEVQKLNSLKADVVLKEATRRVSEPAYRAVMRGAGQTIAGAAQSMQDPATLGAIALTPVAPEVPAVLFGYLGAKAVGEGAGELSVPGNLDTAGMTRKILEMGLMTAGARGAGEALMESYRPRTGTKGLRDQGTKGPGLPPNAVSEFGGEADLPPPSGQQGVENVAPGATGSDVLQPEAPKTVEVTESESPLESPPSPQPSPPGEGENSAAQPSYEAGGAILNKNLNETIYAREPVPAALARQYEEANGRPIAWPEGYKLEGENFVYTEPARNLTPQQEMVRENQEAMRKLTEAKKQAEEAERQGEQQGDADSEPQPWALTKEEWANGVRNKHRAELQALGFSGEIEPKMDTHYWRVKHALERGEPVPDRVVAEYPDLAAEHKAIRESLKERNEPTPEEMEPNWDVGPVERPPDILDWINDNHPEGVRFTKAEFGDYVRQYKERLKELKPKQRLDIQTWKRNDFLRSESGSAADRVLDAMHREGIYHRIENEDDLADAMLRAMEQRLAMAKMGAQDLTGRFLADPVEGWLSKAIAATDPLKGRTLEGVFGAPVWLAQSVAHGALRVVRAAYVAGRDLAGAIAAGIEHLRGLNLEGFNEGEARTWLESSLGLRQRAESIEAGDATEPVKTAVAGDALYTVRTHAQVEAEARGIIGASGMDAAFQTFKDPNSGLKMDTRAALGAVLENEFRTQERVARASGNTPAADALAQKQVELWRADAYGTELAQGLSARNLYNGLSPTAKLRQAQELFDEAGRHELERQKPSIETVKTAIQQGHADAVEAVKQDAQVNQAAREAVDAAVAGSAETHRAVVLDLAGPWSESPAILAHAREAVRAKVDELMNRGPRPPGLTPAAHLRQMLDDLAQRAAGIAAGHYQGAEPGSTLAQKLQQRLGLSAEHAGRLAKQLDAEWARQVETAKKALPKKIAQQRAARDTGTALETDRQVDAAIRKQLRDLNLKLGQVLTQETGRVDATGKSVADRVVQTSGLTGAAADALRAKLEQRWSELLKRAAQQRLEAMERGGAVVTRKMRGMFGDLVDLHRLGALSDPRFYDVVKRKLELPQLTDTLAREIVRRANDLEKLPEGELRDRGATQLLNYVVQQRGLSWTELPMGIYISNLLAGIKTPAKILFENGTLLVSQTLATLRNPTLMAHPWELVGKPGLRGAGRGLLHSLEVLRSGTVVGVRGDIARAASILEQRPLGRYDWLNIWKWPLRAVAAAHVPLFKPAWEMKQASIAARVAKTEGLRGQALVRRVADLMGQTEERVAQARNQAQTELQGAGYFEPRQPGESRIAYDKRALREKLDLRRRVGEIITQGREQRMPGSAETARAHALHFTYLGKPYGFIGFVGELVRNGIERGRSSEPLYAAAVKSQIPFTTVASNIINEHLNWTPIGAVRAALSHENRVTEWLGKWHLATPGRLYGEPITDPAARGDLYARSAAGTALYFGLAHMVAQGVIKLNGPGPAAAQARKQWRDAGNEPWSVEVGGRRYSYVNTPWASGMGVLGAWNDWTHFGKGEEADANTRLAFALKAVMGQALAVPMLTGLRDFLEATSQSTGTGGHQFEKIFTRTASTLVFPKWARDVDQAFDSTLYDQTGMGALLASQVPFVRRENKPVLNRLGEPVQRGVWSSWTAKPDQDPIWRTLVEKNAFIPEPSRNQIVGDRSRGPDHYRAITEEELYDLVAESGPRIRARLERALEGATFIGDKLYPPLNQAEPWQAQAVVRHIAHEEESRAKAKLRF